MKVLVAGGAGFIGSHLCKSLLKKDYKVVCLDNLITGSKKNIEEFLNSPNFKFINYDIFDKFKNSTFKIQNLDYIYHLASPASPQNFQEYPLKILLVNSIGTYNLLELARKTGAKFLYASSSETYGEPKEHPQKETYWGNVNPVGPRSCYDEGKRFGEAITASYIRKYKINARIIRIFNTYGPKMKEDDGRVISNFVNQAIKNKALTVYGDGKQTRSFCFVSDMVEGLIRAMEEKKTRGRIFNLGNPDERKILDIAFLIKKITKTKSKIVFNSLPCDDPTRRKPDIKKAKRILSWKPKINLVQGLKKTIDYFRNVS